MSTALVPTNPGVLMTQATDVAGVCGEIVKRTALTIQGRKYVRVEGWQSIAAAYGCVASSVNVQKVAGGVKATGELHRISDGALIASAEGFVGEDEPTWFGGTVTSYGKEKTLPKRADYAIQAMAQTRAISRVCRSAFAFVVVMIDSKLSTTPAEEMMGVYEHEAPDAKATGGTTSLGAGDSPTAPTAPGAPAEYATTDALIVKAREFAECGTATYTMFFEGLSAPQQKVLGKKRHDELWAIAEKFDTATQA